MSLLIKKIVLGTALLLPVLAAQATDGDVDYSAPYIWVNPETGQIETINPGPQPKAHPMMTEQQPAPVVETAAAPADTASGGDAAADSSGSGIKGGMILAGGLIILAIAAVTLRRGRGKSGDSPA